MQSEGGVISNAPSMRPDPNAPRLTKLILFSMVMKCLLKPVYSSGQSGVAWQCKWRQAKS